MILISKSVSFVEQAVLKDEKGSFLAIKGTINGETITIASVYTTNVSQLKFLDDTFRKMVEFVEGFLVLAGDFNYISDLRND